MCTDKKEEEWFFEDLVLERNHIFFFFGFVLAASCELWYPILVNKLSSVCVDPSILRLSVML